MFRHVAIKNEKITIGSETFTLGPDGALDHAPESPDTMRRLIRSKRFEKMKDWSPFEVAPEVLGVQPPSPMDIHDKTGLPLRICKMASALEALFADQGYVPYGDKPRSIFGCGEIAKVAGSAKKAKSKPAKAPKKAKAASSSDGAKEPAVKASEAPKFDAKPFTGGEAKPEPKKKGGKKKG